LGKKVTKTVITVPAYFNDSQRKATKKSLNKSINPDEAVAFGAAIQAAVLMGMKENLVVIDVSHYLLVLKHLVV